MNIQSIYLKLLQEFISFKSISTDKSFQKEMYRTVQWLNHIFKDMGFKAHIVKGKNCNPVIIARYVANPAFKTFLVYGHYDIQPAQRKDGWNSDPFILTKKGNKYVARGVVDNKGQILMHTAAVFDAIQTGTLASNVTFLIEGNEESGNADLKGIMRKNKKLLGCDAIIISDGEMIGKNPVLETSFRGGGNVRIVYTSSTNDRHSGLYGGTIPNAAFELSQLLSKIKVNNKVAIPSFYDSVLPITYEQQRMGKTLDTIQSIKDNAGVNILLTEKGIGEHVQIGLRPTIEISGISSGYTGTGFKSIVPCTAEARLNVRTVYPQSTQKVMEAIQEFIKQQTLSYVDTHIETENFGDAIRVDVQDTTIQKIKNLLEKVYKKKVLYQHVGGSIPVVADMQSILKKPIAMVSLGNDDCNMHGANENLSEYHMRKGLELTSFLWRNTF